MNGRATGGSVRRWALCAVALVGFSCAGGDAPGTPTTTTAVVDDLGDCDDVSGLVPVRAVMAGAPGACRDWVEVAYGRAVLGSTGSASVWTANTVNGNPLIVGAIHSLGLGWFGPAGSEIEEAIVDPAGEIGVARLFLVRPDGSEPDQLASPWFRLYNPAIGADRNVNFLHDVVPREDFYVAVTDTQLLAVDGIAPIVGPLMIGPVPLFDPAGLTTTAPTWAEATGGDLVVLFGYPADSGVLSVGIGRVLDDDQARSAVDALRQRGDPEGEIAYDPAIEMIIEGHAVAGMSGGPVVDREGRLVGVLVRASDNNLQVQYLRAVRMSYVSARTTESLAAATDPLRAVAKGYFESP